MGGRKQMRGHLRQRYDGVYSIVLYLGRNEQGKKNYKWITFHGTKREAEKKLAEILNEYNNSGYIEPAAMTVGEFLGKWLSEAIKPFRKQKTFDAYESAVRIHFAPALGVTKLKDLNALQVQTFFNKMTQEVSPASVRSYYRTIRAAFNQAVKWGLMKQNPAEGVVLPKARENKKKSLDLEQINLLLKTAKDYDHYPLFLLAVMTGMREGELLALRWKNVDLERRFLFVESTLTKGGLNPVFSEVKTTRSSRPVVLPQVAIDVLGKLRDDQAKHFKDLGIKWNQETLVFTSWTGHPLNKTNVYRSLQRILNKAGLPQTSVHELRHSHVTLLLELGVPIELAAGRMGHNPVVAREVYFHTTQTAQSMIADKLDQVFQPEDDI
jgi:integrase